MSSSRPQINKVLHVNTNTGAVLDGYNSTGGFTSECVSLENLILFSGTAKFSGSNVGGTIKLQLSNDKVDLTASQTPTIWVDVASSSQVLSAAGSYALNTGKAGYRFVRVVYTPGGSESSTVKVTVNGKG